jgi:UDP-glucose 4-epimerase
MKQILITGCAGLIGANFSRFLLEKGYFVIGIDNFFGGYEDFLPSFDNFIFYKKNLESDDMKNIFDLHNIDCVFHFAAYAAEGLSPFIRKFNYINNVLSSVSLINECIERKNLTNIHITKLPSPSQLIQSKYNQEHRKEAFEQLNKLIVC